MRQAALRLASENLGGILTFAGKHLGINYDMMLTPPQGLYVCHLSNLEGLSFCVYKMEMLVVVVTAMLSYTTHASPGLQLRKRSEVIIVRGPERITPSSGMLLGLVE